MWSESGEVGGVESFGSGYVNVCVSVVEVDWIRYWRMNPHGMGEWGEGWHWGWCRVHLGREDFGAVDRGGGGEGREGKRDRGRGRKREGERKRWKEEGEGERKIE